MQKVVPGVSEAAQLTGVPLDHDYGLQCQDVKVINVNVNVKSLWFNMFALMSLSVCKVFLSSCCCAIVAVTLVLTHGLGHCLPPQGHEDKTPFGLQAVSVSRWAGPMHWQEALEVWKAMANISTDQA